MQKSTKFYDQAEGKQQVYQFGTLQFYEEGCGLLPVPATLKEETLSRIDCTHCKHREFSRLYDSVQKLEIFMRFRTHMRRRISNLFSTCFDEVCKAHREHSFSINLVRRRTDSDPLETYNHDQLNED